MPQIDNPFGGTNWFKPITTSTMDDAEQLLVAGPASGCLVMSDHQTAGQGRFTSRRWEAAPGESLLFTLIIPPELASPAKKGPPVSLILALGLAEWLDSLGLAVSIKWPNDILIAGRKLAGILVTGTRGHYLAGIGLNLKQTGFPPELRRPATSLLLEGHQATAISCLPGVLDSLRTAFDRSDWQARCEARLWQHGQDVEISLADGTITSGRIEGLGQDGALLLSTDQGCRRILSGE